MLIYYLLTQTISLIKLNQKMMFMKNTNTCLTAVNSNQKILILLTKKLFPK